MLNPSVVEFLSSVIIDISFSSVISVQYFYIFHLFVEILTSFIDCSLDLGEYLYDHYFELFIR